MDKKYNISIKTFDTKEAVISKFNNVSQFRELENKLDFITENGVYICFFYKYIINYSWVEVK